MNRAATKWIVPDKISDDIDDRLSKYPNLIRQVLFNRGITTDEKADSYLRANSPEYSPFLLKSMDSAIEIIREAIISEKKIIVFGDYDVDGVTASVTLVQLLERYKVDVAVFIPNRFDEGYGLSFDAVASVMEKKPDLIITVDCGVRSVAEVDYLREQGVKVIITDHHQPHETIPRADAVICPKQPGDTYPYKHLAGVGIAYKLAQALLARYPIKGKSVDDWIDLVAVGTIADLAPLDGENRTLSRRGLRRMRFGQNKGLLALANVSGTNISQIRSEDIGFRIGPRLNAAGRLDSAYAAFHLLMAKTSKEAGDLALILDQENRKRQQITREIQQKAEEMYDPEIHKHFLFFWSEEFHEGVVGLAASKLADKFYQPAIVGVLKDGLVRASCRSIAEINITAALDRCSDLLIQHGGHAMAAGLSIQQEKTHQFMEVFNQVLEETLQGKELVKTIHAESEVAFAELFPENLRYYEVLEPLGNRNPSPLFITRNVEVKRVHPIGREKEHLKMTLTNGNLGFTAVAWQFGDAYDTLSQAGKIDVLYAYEINEYNGSTNLQLRIVDFKIASEDEKL